MVSLLFAVCWKGLNSVSGHKYFNMLRSEARDTLYSVQQPGHVEPRKQIKQAAHLREDLPALTV